MRFETHKIHFNLNLIFCVFECSVLPGVASLNSNTKAFGKVLFIFLISKEQYQQTDIIDPRSSNQSQQNVIISIGHSMSTVRHIHHSPY